ncbi:LuxR C-terminal-related transcriptional regulator [Kitasatospora sp. NPDC056783]|uniref:response regulator transcription factor n=1 Tax=Kitasatospora sp. NPDC056783 TaxID=3345943 RepID=UPI0036837CE9
MQRVPVLVDAVDRISAAGTASAIREQPALELVSEGETRPGGVAVVVTERIDEPTAERCRRFVRGHGLRLVTVVTGVNEHELLRAVECGTSAVLWRHETSPEKLTSAVLAAHRGDGDLPPDLLGRLLAQVGRLQRNVLQPQGLGFAGVTEREATVLRLIADGLDTAEIAGRLAYSERTIKTVLQGVMTRMQLRNRAHAVAYALREGFI